MSRRALLIVSILISLALHAGLLVFAPRLPMLEATIQNDLAVSQFRINLYEGDIPPSQQAPDTPGAGLSTRPGSIPDLVTTLSEEMTPSDSFLNEPAEIPMLQERLATEMLDRDREPIDDSAVRDIVESKVIEIAEETARKDLQIARRLVAPSDTRFIPEGEDPILRGDPEQLPPDVLLIDPFGPGGGPGGGSLGDTASPSGTDPSQLPPVRPPREAHIERPGESGFELEEGGLPELPAESIMVRAPIEEELRRESAFEFMDDLVDVNLRTYRPPAGPYAYFQLQIVPKSEGALEPLPKDVTFVIDASNSIVQHKLERTARGVSTAIKRLRPEDRFNVVLFRDTPTLFRSELTPATEEHKASADAFLRGIQARGETDVYQAIRSVLDLPTRDGVPHIVMVVTDGRPTTGMKDGRSIINALSRDNDLRHSIYAFGGGRTVNQYLLDLLAFRNKGESNVVPTFDRIDSAFIDFFSRLRDPILVDCDIDIASLDDSEIYPRNIPDFYQNNVVAVYGRFDPARSGEFALRLTGRAGERQKEVVFRADLAKASPGDPEIARNWAFRKVYELIAEISRVGEKPELLAELRALSNEYNIRTSYSE